MCDMRITYLGFELPHPIIVGASPFADSLDGIRRAEDAGAAAIVFRSLFEEQLDTEAMATFYAMESHAQMFAEASSFMPDPPDFAMGAGQYLDSIEHAKQAVNIPVIASLNGTSRGGWLRYAREIQQAGADALELNVFDVPMNPDVSAAAIEDNLTEIVRELRSHVSIPLAVKLSPFHTSLTHFARALENAGADALVVFNRFYESDLDVENLDLLPQMKLSDSRELLLRLRWMAILSGTLQKAQLSATGGVHNEIDAIKAVMCGASAVQMVSEILHHGLGRIRQVVEGMDRFLDEHEYESLRSMRGSMNILRSPDPHGYARANYMRMLQTWSTA